MQDYKGNLSEAVELQEEAFFCERIDEMLYDRLEQECGCVMYIDVDYSEKQEGEIEGHAIEFESTGRWSQQGFSVQQPLFSAYIPWWRGKSLSNSIQYPFVVYFNLSQKSLINPFF